MAGWVRLRGTLQVPSGSGPAAGGCAFRLRPLHLQRQLQRPKQQLAFRGMAGWVRLRGTLQVPS
ncbi:hypothetical protein C7E25_05805, partial [Stenotrophomonas maltophilia]